MKPNLRCLNCFVIADHISILSNVAADEQRSATENLFDDAECLLQPLVRPPAGGQADARSAANGWSDAGAEAIGRRLQCEVRRGPGERCCPPSGQSPPAPLLALSCQQM